MLKFTKCDKYCEFSIITSFCFDCPALMCDKCKRLMHESLDIKNHRFICFDNKNLNWNSKETISNLFTDKVMVENIFTEVSRTFLEELNDENAWSCPLCSMDNPGKCTRCCICFHIPIGSVIISNKSSEYEKKLNFVSEKLFSIPSELKSKTNIPFENVLYRFFRWKNIKKLSILDWFKNVYLNDKHLSIINEVITKLETNHVEEDLLMTEYDKCIQLKNKRIAGIYPNKKMLPSKFLITCDEINKSNFLGKKFLGKELTNTDIWNLICKNSEYTEHEKRVLMTEMYIDNNDKIVLLQDFIKDEKMGTYLKESFSGNRTELIHIKQAVMDYFLIEDAIKFLRKYCEICYNEFPMPEMIVFITCKHQICKTCALTWLNDAIRNKFPCQWFCFMCSESENEHIDTNLYYLFLREILVDQKELQNILEMKLFQQESISNSNFHWCPNNKCGFGFEVMSNEILKIQCTNCKSFLCGNCNRMWNEKHENINCQEYELLIMKEDPFLLNIIGIECPKCHMRYSLAAGGCLHFKCVSCGIEFCGGCSELYFQSCENPQCVQKALHAHHPRNCLAHLRDYDIEILEDMLQGHEYTHLESKDNTVCPVIVYDIEYKESECNGQVYLTTGLCLKHYKEYLVQFINHFKIDPVDFCDSDKINLMLFQLLLPTLEKRNEEDDNQFKLRLIEEVKEKCKFYIPSSIQEKSISC